MLCIIMNPMIHMYFISNNKKNSKLCGQEAITFWVYGYRRVVTNVSKNINMLFMGEWYIIIFKIDT
jgi:hypothetical protein